jgi:hypothetical protein
LREATPAPSDAGAYRGRLVPVFAAVVVLLVVALGGLAARSDSWASAPTSAPPPASEPSAIPTLVPTPTAVAAPPAPSAREAGAGWPIADVLFVVVLLLLAGGLVLLAGGRACAAPSGSQTRDRRGDRESGGAEAGRGRVALGGAPGPGRGQRSARRP